MEVGFCHFTMFQVSDGGFHCSLANNVARGVSQIVNSFTDGSHLQRFLAAGEEFV